MNVYVNTDELDNLCRFGYSNLWVSVNPQEIETAKRDLSACLQTVNNGIRM